MASRSKGIKSEKLEKADVNLEEIDDTLIPSHIVDQASQRIFIISLFILIQCWKIRDILVIKSSVQDSIGGFTPPNNFTFVLKYALIDGTFLWMLPILNIPYLVFSPFKTFMLTIVLNGTSLLLASDLTIPLVSGWVLPIWRVVYNKRELTFLGESVNTNNVIDMDSHFKGRYTIHYLPDSSAKFNPFKFDNLCIDPSTSNAVNIPIEFNITTEINFLQIQHTDPFNEVHYKNYTGSELNKLLKKDYQHLKELTRKTWNDNRIFHIEVPLSLPGNYQISSVKDLNGISIRTYKSEVLLGYCPNAKFTYSKALDLPKYKCLGEATSQSLSDVQLPLVSVYGVAPFKLKFEIILNGKRHKTIETELDDIVIDDTTRKNYKQKNDLGWLELSAVTRNVLEQEMLKDEFFMSLKQAGKLEFKLAQITDFLGNTRIYNPASRHQDIWFSISLVKERQVSFDHVDHNNVLLKNGSKFLGFSHLNDMGSDEFPVEITISYENATSIGRPVEFTKTFNNKHELSKGIEINKEGTYSLKGGRTKMCPFDLTNSKAIDIVMAPEPLVYITVTPLVDKCVGTTGYEFAFDLSGTPPFSIQYNVYRNDTNGILTPLFNEHGKLAHLINILDHTYKFEYRPPKEGSYVIVFGSLTDLYYDKEPLLLDKALHTYLMYFNKRSKVSFFEEERVSQPQKRLPACKNTSVDIPIYLEGNAPFSIKYCLLDLETQKHYTGVKNLDSLPEGKHIVSTPILAKGGEFELQILEARDKLGCDLELSKHERVIITARRDIPLIGYAMKERKKEVKIIEGDSYRVPLGMDSSLGKSLSDIVEYTITDLVDGKLVQKKKSKITQYLNVQEEGNYSLVSYSSGGCAGKISDAEKVVSVSYFERPTLSLLTDEDKIERYHDEQTTKRVGLKSVCQNCVNQVRLDLKGLEPFVIDYDIKLPDGKVETRSMTINSNKVTINLPTRAHGKYAHQFKGIYDRRYTRERMQRLPSKDEVLPEVEYYVNPTPSITFGSKNPYFQICESSLRSGNNSLSAVPVNLVGKFPFQINASLTHAASGVAETFQLDSVESPSLDLNAVFLKKKGVSLYLTLLIGEHVLTFNKLTDANNCTRSDFSQLNSFLISVTEVPNITKVLKKSHHCVGDHIAYSLSGVTPFTVFYKFNDKIQKAELSNLFRRLASKPGKLSVVALLDSSANQCLVNFNQNTDKYKSLELDIYDLPSVEVNQGDHIIENIHEGDQKEIKFSFVGIPPFKLVYTRSVEPEVTKDKAKPQRKGDRNLKHKVETKVVEDIWDYEYSVFTSLEGTYEAIEVQDAYCTARKY